jgi:iron-sulfur cluster protein
MNGTIGPFVERYREALANGQLRQNLLKFQRNYAVNRRAVFERYRREGAGVGVAEPTFEGQRRQLADAKDVALREHAEYLARFKERAEAAGARVFFATTAEDANRYVVGLCRARGAELFAKGKSMLSEEIFLNHALEAAGVRPVETDLGEWILQLVHETPSHMVVPAIHKNRHEVSVVLEQAVGRAVSREDVGEMARVARDELRKVFAAADVGMTGANALIAETGTIMLVTNEGNGRLTSSLPPVHVVIAGLEKLVPTFRDAAAQVRLLARSATNQDISTYTTFITGPDRPDRELHIVILDNGRSVMAATPDFAEALRCIRCAACADVCPPYQVVGGHVFGYVYSGAIGLVNTPFHHGIEAAAGPQSLCVSCNACATVCPVGIPLPGQILDVRHMVARTQGLPPQKRLVLGVWKRPWLFDALCRLASVIQRPFVTRAGAAGRRRRNGPAGTDGPAARMLRLPLPEALRWRTPPALARHPARDRLLGRTFEPLPDGPLATVGARGKTVAYFVQCLTDRFAPEQAEAAVRVLRACGARVAVPDRQHCCGLPGIDAGDRATAVSLARATIDALERVPADYVVTAAASCAIALEHDYQHLLRDDPEWRDRAARLAAKTFDLVSFLDRVVKPPAGALARPATAPPLTYHSFCQSTNVLGIAPAARRLLREVCGLDLRDLPEGEVCCGFGGSTSFDHPLVAREIVARKLDNVAQTGAALLVTDNPGCLLHLRGAAHARGTNLRVAHIAEVLAERL